MKRSLIFVAMLAIATVLALFVVQPTASPVQASHKAVVKISGQVTNSGIPLTLQVGAQASGPASSLSGQGFDSPIPGFKGGYCRIRLTTGSVSGSLVTLSGTVVFSQDPLNLNAPVTFTADASTGAITFDFGGTMFTGTGSVVIAHQ